MLYEVITEEAMFIRATSFTALVLMLLLAPAAGAYVGILNSSDLGIIATGNWGMGGTTLEWNVITSYSIHYTKLYDMTRCEPGSISQMTNVRTLR